MAEHRSQRTEKPTGKKISDARKKGNVPRSKELPSALVLAMFLVFCHVFGADWMGRLREVLSYCFTNLTIDDLAPTEWLVELRVIGSMAAGLMIFPVGMIAAAGIGGQLLQGPPPFSLEPLRLDFSKINPTKGLKNIFTRKSLATLSKAILNLVLFTTIAVTAIRDALTGGALGAPGVEGTLGAIFLIVNKVIFRCAVLWFFLAAVDLLFTRHDYIRNLMMTKQEVKDERKQLEGDPRVKSRIRSKQFEMARSRMMADVPNATVVVTNPTHIAVALRYVPGEMVVPKLLAKGRALLAERIREIAAEHSIPIVQDPPLARSIYRSVPVGGYVPVGLYRAVAEVLALVMRKDGRGRRRPVEQPGVSG